MPELPEIVTVYIEALRTRWAAGRWSNRACAAPSSCARSLPPLDVLHGCRSTAVHRIGKRIVLGFGDRLFLVVHLMIAGRLRWRAPGQKPGISPRMILATLRVRPRNTVADRGRIEEARVDAPGRGRARCGRSIPAASNRSRRARRVPDAADAREPHAQAGADRSASLQRHRQRLLGRDPARRAAVAAHADALAVGDEEVARLHERDARNAARPGSTGCGPKPAARFPRR